MKTCGQCKEPACRSLGFNPDLAACDDFTSKAIEEVLPDWQPTLADFERLEGLYLAGMDEIARLETRIAGFEQAVAELVRWAQGDEAP